MFRKHKGKFAAGSRNRYQSGNVPQDPTKKKKAWKWVLLTILLILLALIRRHCHFRYHLSKQDSAGRP